MHSRVLSLRCHCHHERFHWQGWRCSAGLIIRTCRQADLTEQLALSQAQWQALFAASGFRLEGVHPTRGTLKIVEASPV